MFNKKNKMPYIISEIGVNHDGNIEIAKRLIENSFLAGANCVKFQLFKPSELVTKKALVAPYQKKNNPNQINQKKMLEKYMLNFDQIKLLKNFSKNVGIDFLVTPFDMESLIFLEDIGQKSIKFSSSDLTSIPLIRKATSFAEKIIISIGMSNLDDINFAIDLISSTNFPLSDLVILHCNTAYPTPDDDANLINISHLSKRYKECSIGFSDHTSGIDAAPIASILGAKVIEKHVTYNKSAVGPDHRASITTNELKKLIKKIEKTNILLGNIDFSISNSEKENYVPATKSIVAKINIKIGEIFSEENITLKRPGNGLSPKRWDDVLGNKAKLNFKKDDYIEI